MLAPIALSLPRDLLNGVGLLGHHRSTILPFRLPHDAPMIAPIALSLPSRTFCTASALLGHHLLDDPGQLVAAGAAEALGLDDRGGVAALVDQLAEHLLRRGAGDVAGGHHRHQLRQRRGLQLRRGRVLVADARHHLARHPVRERARVRAVGRDGGLEEVPELRAERQLLRGVRPAGRAHPRSARRAGRAARAARRVPARASPPWARSAPGRARGSSGSRAPPPWSAAG